MSMIAPIRRRALGRPSPLEVAPATEVVAPLQRPVSDLSVQRLTTVIERLTTFTTSEILDHAIGIGAVRHCNEIGPILERLTVLGVITPCHRGGPTWTSTSEPAL
jgi:hypothetical protein